MSITPPDPTPVPVPPPEPSDPDLPLETPPPIEEPPPDYPPDEAPDPNPDENDNPPRRMSGPALLVSRGGTLRRIGVFEDLRTYPLTDAVARSAEASVLRPFARSAGRG